MVNVPFRQSVGSNQQTYQRLNASLHLNLRRQIFIAVCDDLLLRDRLATQLQTELNPPALTAPSALPASSLPPYPHLVSLQLSLDDPNPLLQIAQWLTQSPPPVVEGVQAAIPAFQILGIEHLTRQSSAMQHLFFTHLQTIERNLPLLDFSLLLWMTQPWFHALPHSAPEFWHCRTGVFEFVGDPTPLTITSPEYFGTQSPQQTIASALPPSYLEKTTPPFVEEKRQDTQAEEPLITSALGNDVRSEMSWLALPPLSQDEEAGTDSNQLEACPSPAAADGESIAPPLGLSSDLPLEESWSSLLEEELQEDTETEGLTQAEISMLLGNVSPLPLQEDRSAEGLTEADVIDDVIDDVIEINITAAAGNLTDILDSPIDSPDVAKPLPATETAESTTPAEGLENPWLLLAEELTQPYELEETAPSPGLQTSTPETAIDAAHSPQVAATSDQDADAARAIAFVPMHLPDGLADREQVQSIVQQIEQLHQQQVAPAILVEAYRSLGNLCRDRIEQGEVTPPNLIVAIQAYEQALLRLSESSPLWVDILNDLGNLYWMASRTTPNGPEALACLNQAIQFYQFALTKIDPQAQSHTYPMVQNNLGAAYADLARHDNPTQNLECSVEAYRQALRWRTPDTDPLRYASTQNNLGTTYWNLAQYKEAPTNLKLAIAAYADALQYYNPAEEPLNYAMIQNNLGTAYWNLAQHERSQNWLMSAVLAYRLALEYRTLEANPVAHAATQNNLGTAYWHMANEAEQAQTRIEYLQEAIESYEAALHAVKHLQTHQPHAMALLNFDTFATHNNLGLAYYQIATDALHNLDSTKQSHRLQAALEHHVLAWQGWAQKDNLRQTAFSCIVQTIQAFYNQLGLPGQSLALSRVPGELLPEILPKL